MEVHKTYPSKALILNSFIVNLLAAVYQSHVECRSFVIAVIGSQRWLYLRHPSWGNVQNRRYRAGDVFTIAPIYQKDLPGNLSLRTLGRI